MFSKEIIQHLKSQILSVQKKQLVWFLLFWGALIYLNALGNQLFWDDHDGIVNNAYIKNWRYLRNYFSENLIAGAGLQSNYWRPLLLIIFSLGWKVWGLWPVGFHLISIATHLLAGYLLFELLRKLTGQKWLAFFPALFFLSHPLQTEAVTYVSGLADPLSAVLIFWGLLLYLEKRSTGKFWPVWGVFALALMTKEKNLIFFPVLLALLEASLFFKENFRWNYSSFTQWLTDNLKKNWPILAMGCFYVLLRATSLNFDNTFNLYAQPNLYADSLLIRTWTFLKIFPQYLGLIFWPFDLHMERLVKIEISPFSFPVFFGLVLLAGLFWRGFSQARKRPLIFLALGWFLLSLLSSSVIPAVSAGIMYEHYLYLPLAGFFFWLTLEVEIFWPKIQASQKYLLGGILILFASLLFFSFLTFQRNRVWKEPIVFYEDVLKYNQTSLRIWNNLGMAYAEAQQPEKAVFAYQKAIELDQENASAPPRHNLANALSALGEKEKALFYYQAALSIDPEFIFSYYPLWKLFQEEGRRDEGIAFFKNLKKQAPEKHWEIDKLIEEMEKSSPDQKK